MGGSQELGLACLAWVWLRLKSGWPAEVSLPRHESHFDRIMEREAREAGMMMENGHVTLSLDHQSRLAELDTTTPQTPLSCHRRLFQILGMLQRLGGAREVAGPPGQLIDETTTARSLGIDVIALSNVILIPPASWHVANRHHKLIVIFINRSGS